jgi:hypothetical protein
MRIYPYYALFLCEVIMIKGEGYVKVCNGAGRGDDQQQMHFIQREGRDMLDRAEGIHAVFPEARMGGA